MKLYVRVDDRLIHGQIVTAWAKILGINQILAVDNDLAKNNMLADIMLMGVPKQFHPQIVSIDDVEGKLQGMHEDTVLLLVRRASGIPNTNSSLTSITIGNCSKTDDSSWIYKGVGVGQTLYFSAEDLNALNAWAGRGVMVCFQQMPQDKKVMWDTLKSALKEYRRE